MFKFKYFSGFFFSNKKRKEDEELESKNSDKNSTKNCQNDSTKSEKVSTKSEKDSIKMDSTKNGTNALKPEASAKIGNWFLNKKLGLKLFLVLFINFTLMCF